MNKENKLKMLQKLIDKSDEVKIMDSSDPIFKSWKDLCERTFAKIYGEQSRELQQFLNLKFYYNPSMWTMGHDYSHEHRQCFIRDFNTAKTNMELLKEEINEFSEDDQNIEESILNEYESIFICHSSKDKSIVEDLIDIIETIGIPSSRIFCSSISGYGVPLGDDFIQKLKEEITRNVLVIFVLSEEFYSSPVCLCEMGATWALSKENIPILIPPFSFEKMKGVFPLTQGMMINDELSLNLLHDKIVELFKIVPQQQTTWERKRARIVSRINEKIDA